jgi:undecaprenyl-diphosphatase
MTRSQLLDNANRLDVRLCMCANRIARSNPVLKFFRIVSRLGDGVFWYSLTATMPLLLGQRGLIAATQMLLTGGLGFLIYRQLKERLVRERPFVRLAGIQCFMPPLDRYSFPSGHTLHAVAFTFVACSYVPWLAILLIPFATTVALSRVVLGLHYPSDVAAGAVIGLVLGASTNLLFF